MDVDLYQLKKILDLALPYARISIKFFPGNEAQFDFIRIVYEEGILRITHIISIFYDPDKEELLAISTSRELPSWFTDIFNATHYCSDSNVYVISLKE